MKKWYLSLAFIAVLAGCTSEKPDDDATTKSTTTNDTTTEQNDTIKSTDNDDASANATEDTTNKEVKEEATATTNASTIDFKKYFLADGAKASFLGEGMEFAAYTLETHWLNDKYVATYKNDGATKSQQIYRVNADNIELVVDDSFELEPETPTIGWLDKTEAMEVVLQAPLEKDQKFSEWQVIATDQTVETPLQTFTKVIEVQRKGKDFTEQRFFAEGFGQIKSVYTMEIEGSHEPYIIISSIEKVEGK